MKIRLYTIDKAGHWLGVEVNGKVFLITYLGKNGDLIRL